MDSKDNPDQNDAEESTSHNTKKPEKPKSQSVRKAEPKVVTQEDAGPSRIIDLPGAIPHSPKLGLKQGLSKSEHCLAHIITKKDVANALTSLSFGTSNPPVKNLNLRDFKITVVDTCENADKMDSATLVDLKRFMASCFKFNKETPNVPTLPEVPVQNIHATISTGINDIQELPNSSCVTAQTDNVVFNKTNEVIITNTNPIEPKQSKVTDGNKKKTSGSLSERSDLGLAQRDSLSSIGSNVCRICMTRGRER